MHGERHLDHRHIRRFGTVGQYTGTAGACGKAFRSEVDIMQMKNDEIVMRYRQAKNKGDQVQILAELNNCPVERIIGILTSAGIDNRCFNKLRAKLDMQEQPVIEEPKKIPYKKPEIIEPPSTKSSEPAEDAADKQLSEQSCYCEELFEPIRKEVAALMDKRRGIYAELRKVDAALAKYVEFFSAEMLQIDTLKKDGDISG